MNELIELLAAELPRAVRWSGALARLLRRHDISLAGKHSGSADTDALTLADLSVQESARIMGAHPMTVGVHLHRARTRLRDLLGDDVD